MPSQPLDPGWDFSSVIDLIDSDVHGIRSPTLRPTTRTRPLISALKEDGGVRLGSFAKLYEGLGFSNNAPAPALPPLDPESELSNSDDVLLPSPVLTNLQSLVKLIDNVDEPSTSGLSKKQRKKARRQAEKELKEQIAKEQEQEASLQKQLQDIVDASIKTEAAIESPSKPLRTQSRSNVSVKIQSANPSATPAPVMTAIAPTPQKEPKTPKNPPRPILSKRASTAQPAQPITVTKVIEAQSVQPVQTVFIRPQFTALGTPAQFQHPAAPQFVAQLKTPQVATPAGRGGLVPRTVGPVTVTRHSQPPPSTQPPTSPTRLVLSPLTVTIRSQVERHLHMFHNLLSHFPDDQKWLVSPKQLVNEKTAAHGLHVFVDASNIMYGFRDTLRNYGIFQPFDMSFDSLALIMERRRPVGKRVFAGSHREANPLPHVTKLVETSKAVGYESNVKEQVLIVREESDKKKFFNDVKKLGWLKAQQMRSGSGSDSETGPDPTPKTQAAPKWVEQGVDEILHLKMCQSIIDTEFPSTMVLATGDGAEAEMSDGFLAHVERALKNGWKVELISWRQQTNGGYKNKKFRTKWADNFRIIELDDFLEDLIDTP